MNLSFLQDGWEPNYVTFEQKELEKGKNKRDVLSNLFLNYIEKYVIPFKKDNILYFRFDFGARKIEVPCVELEQMLLELKQNEENDKSEVMVKPKEIADFFLYFHLIEATEKGFKMVKDTVKKYGDASLATLLGHILVEKHFPVETL